ncbi:hypothetical protein [Phenylobacterium sp.]|uniref:hypothetical protein n=1 Tax=Phenylobacterium sp. TaxID=1871053 RepID=UPI00301B8F2D
MLRIELSALSAQELKRLLDQARARDQSALVQQLVAELEARPSRADEWRSAPRPMTWTPAYEDLLEPEPEAPVSRRNGVMAVTAVIAAVVSAAVTWGLSIPPERTGERPPSAEPPRAAVILASVAPIGPPAAPAQTPDQMPDQALGQTPDEAPPVTAAAEPKLHVASRSTPRRENPCYDLPTAAERLVCGYPSLAIRDRQMRVALARARAGGGDLRALEAEQASFRDVSEDITDHKALADLYDRRIRQIDETAARARAAEPLF